MTSKRTGQLGMSLISIIKTTAGIIEFKKKSLNELIDKSKSDLKDIEIKIQLGFASMKEHLTEYQKRVQNLDEQHRGS